MPQHFLYTLFNHNLDFKKTNVHGQRPNTRAQTFLLTLTEDKISGAEKCRSERKALLALGLPETDQTLQDLQDDQLWSKDISRPARLGDSRKEDPWFWHVGRPSGLTEAEDREWDIERKQCHMLNSDVALISPIHLVDRVKWFRDRSARDRSREEKEILEEELRRSVRYFKHMKNTWVTLATKKPNSPPGYAPYAYKQAAMYEQFAIDTESYQLKAEGKRRVYDDW